jgi:hypothetical protein
MSQAVSGLSGRSLQLIRIGYDLHRFEMVIKSRKTGKDCERTQGNVDMHRSFHLWALSIPALRSGSVDDRLRSRYYPQYEICHIESNQMDSQTETARNSRGK